MATPEIVAEPLIERLRVELLQLELGRTAPLFVALDGRSGAGKSTVAAVARRALGGVPNGDQPTGGPWTSDGIRGPSPDVIVVTVIEGDQFYAGGSAASWDRRPAHEKADRVIDWQRQVTVLRALRDHGRAEWRVFDWDAEDWDADVVPLCPEPFRCRATDVVLLEGAYSARPEFGDLLDLRVLLDPPREVRRAQLLARQGDAYRDDWEARWSDAEDHYFGRIMPPERFDLVLRPE